MTQNAPESFKVGQKVVGVRRSGRRHPSEQQFSWYDEGVVVQVGTAILSIKYPDSKYPQAGWVSETKPAQRIGDNR